MQVTTIGIDIAKRVFQVHGVDSAGTVVVSKAVGRARLVAFLAKIPPCLIGMEACATAHYWARQFQALGHEVRLIPPAYVKPYVRRNKNDAADAAAICEAVTRPSMRFVPVKTADQQAARSLTRVREQLISQRTAATNALRGHLAEFGIVEAIGLRRSRHLRSAIDDPTDTHLPDLARQSLGVLQGQIDALDAAIAEIDRRILAWHKESELSQRLATIPGIGVMTAVTFATAIPDPGFFRSGRELAAWLGLVPRQNSTGGKHRLGRISKRGDARLRGLLIVCASSVLLGQGRCKAGVPKDTWLGRIMAAKPRIVAAVALANKLARIVWAVMTRNEPYRPELGFLPAR